MACRAYHFRASLLVIEVSIAKSKLNIAQVFQFLTQGHKRDIAVETLARDGIVQSKDCGALFMIQNAVRVVATQHSFVATALMQFIHAADVIKLADPIPQLMAAEHTRATTCPKVVKQGSVYYKEAGA